MDRKIKKFLAYIYIILLGIGFLILLIPNILKENSIFMGVYMTIVNLIPTNIGTITICCFLIWLFIKSIEEINNKSKR